MITHYDMLTGEVIEERSDEARNDHTTPVHREAQLRLLSVAEARLTDQRSATTAAVVLPIHHLIGH